MLQTFIDKEARINKAIDKVKAKLKYFADNSDTLPEVEREKWNNWHDLQYRLENRLTDNWSNYKAWHFDTYKFNSY